MSQPQASQCSAGRSMMPHLTRHLRWLRFQNSPLPKSSQLFGLEMLFLPRVQQVCVTRVDHAACRVGDRGCLLLSRCAVTTSPLSDKPPQTHLRHRTPDVTAQEYMQPDNSHPSEASETSRGFGSRRGHTLCSVSDAVLPLSGLFPFAPHIRAGRLPGCVTQGRPSVGK
jgi:hypothetical protein